MNDVNDEQQHVAPERPATERAEEMLGRLGQRFTDMRANVGRALEQRAQQRGGTAGPAGTTQPAPERATETLGDWGKTVGYAAGIAGLRLRQWGARAREEAEDLWAEAQSVRHPGQGETSTPGVANAAAPEGHTEGVEDASATVTETSGEEHRSEQWSESSQPS